MVKHCTEYSLSRAWIAAGCSGIKIFKIWYNCTKNNVIWRKDSVSGLSFSRNFTLGFLMPKKILQACKWKFILSVLHYFSGVLSLLLNIHEREVEAFVTATRAGVTPVCDLSLVGTVSLNLALLGVLFLQSLKLMIRCPVISTSLNLQLINSL